MIILDPGRDECVVWLINSPIINYRNKVTRIKGDVSEICKSLIGRLAEYRKVKNQWGNYVDKLFWKDDIYLDVSVIGQVYKDIFKYYGLSIIDVTPLSGVNATIPVKFEVRN